MFARPAKKVAAPAQKQKTLTKPKTVSVKAGVKPQQAKKCKVEGTKSKPAVRADAGYSLYSSDSEDQVSLAFQEMDTCEKILTHLRHKQKGSSGKGKAKKKKDVGAKPKPLNDVPPGSDVLINPDYGIPQETLRLLRQIQAESNDLTANPAFNTRLTSSTPDPDKHLADQTGSGKSPGNIDTTGHELPVRDVSVVSSVPPSFEHLRNMADMVEIYKRLEMKKHQQLQQEAAFVELEKLKNSQNGQNINNYNQYAINDVPIDQGQMRNYTFQGQSGQTSQTLNESDDKRQSGGFVGTGSLGFSLGQQQTTMSDLGQTGFQPVQTGSSFQSGSMAGFTGDDSDTRRESSITAFQPYISRDSGGVMPPQTWMIQQQQQQQQKNGGPNQGVIDPLRLSQRSETSNDVPISGRSEKSDATSAGTDYVSLPRENIGHSYPGQGHGYPGQQRSESAKDDDVVFQKQNGLYQIHKFSDNKDQKESENKANKSSGSSKGDKSSASSKGDKSSASSKGDSTIHEIPERDVPVTNTETRKPSAARDQHETSGGTFRIEEPGSKCQNMSDMTTSTPRTSNQNTSGTSSTQSGRVVFIPNDSSTQNMIGYVPGMPVIPGANQPIGWPVTYEVAPGGGQMPGGSGMSSMVIGNQGQTTQLSSQVAPQDVSSGSGYTSAVQAQKIAAGEIGVRKLRYLLKELKECNKVTKDTEVSRLVKEIDSTVNAIPQLALTFNLQTEIDLAIQPLRSENSQLRRKVRLINQQLKDKEMASEQEPKDVNFEMLHLQTSNETLQKVIKEEKEVKTRLAAEVQHVYAELHKMKVDRSKLIASVSEKETEQLQIQQEVLLSTQKLRHEVDMIKKDKEMATNRLEALEKENHILQISLQQRDAEIEREREVVELMKESISDLLQELDQSRGGDRTWDHNTSYGLNRLMKIIEEEGTVVPRELTKSQTKRKEIRTPERKVYKFNATTSDSSSNPRLTRAALAYHDRRHTPPGSRSGPDGGRVGPASESELDTLIDMQRKPPRDFSKGGKSDRNHRRTSSSSPVRFKSDRVTNYRRQRASISPVRDRGNRFGAKAGPGGRSAGSRFRPSERERTDGRDVEDRESESPPPQRRVAGLDSFDNRRNRLYGDFGRARPTTGDKKEESSEISVEQSRYSVTDYFKKYPHTSESQLQDTNIDDSTLPMAGRSRKDFTSRPLPQYRTSSAIDDQTLVSSASPMRLKQLTLFGMNGDQTISAIPDDDNVSSVSMDSVTTANTVDDRKFRSGIATLDANIAKLQMALQKTKSMLQ